MAKRPESADDFDSPWKDALQAFFPAFLSFFFADIHADIDWSRGYEALDKEFQQIIRDAEVGKRLAGKLFKVWLRDGHEFWLLIHVEIQGDADEKFSERMFQYNTAIYKLYNREVVSLAVLCDETPDWRPSSFSYGRWGCRMELTFRVAKLLDYQVVEAVNADNPIAAVVQAHLRAQRTRNDPDSRRHWKLRLVKELLIGPFSKSDVRALFRLIDWMMTLPADLEEAFRRDVHIFEQEQHMEYMSSIERYGFKQGREEGIEEGERNGLLEGIAIALDVKFGAAGTRLLKRVRILDDVEKLREFGKFLKKAKTVNEVRDYLS